MPNESRKAIIEAAMPESSLLQNLNIDDEEAFGDEELIDIKNRVNVLRDVSIDMNNMNTDD